MQPSQHILVIRFSAMGDVAMTVPVIQNVLQQNPQVHITVVSNAFLQPLFQGIERCHFYPAYLKKQHKGITGIYKLFKELNAAKKFNAIADLHNVLRTSLLKTFFSFSGIKIETIDKGRKEKKELTRKGNKVFKPLTSTHERYAAVFRKLGLTVILKSDSPVFSKQTIPVAIQHLFSTDKKIIGVAPFAQHEEKMYPLEKMRAVVQQLATENNTILLFGGGKKEAAILQLWADELPDVININGKFSFTEELSIISNIGLMISMDSANMHLACLYGVPVVSIWGATHWYAGFNSWGLEKKNIVQAELSCRPCSVFGNKPCFRGDHACMHMITQQMIFDKIANS